MSEKYKPIKLRYAIPKIKAIEKNYYVDLVNDFAKKAHGHSATISHPETIIYNINNIKSIK